MKLSEIVAQQAIITDLASHERDAVIAELAQALASAGAIAPEAQQEIVASVIERESKGSTGFGKGVAVPHVKHPSVTTMVAAIGLSPSGVEFNALDRQPVHSIMLLLSPEDNPEEHLRAMEVIFKNLSSDMFRRFLRQATTIEEVLTLLDEADNQQLGS